MSATKDGGFSAAHVIADEVRAVTLALLRSPTSSRHWPVDALLDGYAGDRLRELVALSDRRADGVFFTGGDMQRALLDGSLIRASDVVFDPACGAGDLLVGVARELPLEVNLRETLTAWSMKLHGCDIHAALVDAAKERLRLLAVARHAGAGTLQATDADLQEPYFKNVRIADGLSATIKQSANALIVMNPPFSRRPAPVTYTWGIGSINQAALFLTRAVEQLPAHGTVAAILPDVIRTGSRYEKLRDFVAATTDVLQITPLGQFDAHTDVDVFALTLRKRSLGPHAHEVRWWDAPSEQGTIADQFTVRIGRVVDNRDPNEGSELPFLRAADLPKEGNLGPPIRFRRHQGLPFEPPFVLVRRTSRPSSTSQPRAQGVLVTDGGPFFVDNHLIVLSPLDGSVERCQALVDHLRGAGATAWLNDRMRCRHLTVGSIADLPYASATRSSTAESRRTRPPRAGQAKPLQPPRQARPQRLERW